MSVAILLTQTIKKSPQPYNLWRPSNVMAVSYTLNRFITAKKSDVAFNTTVAVIKGKKFYDFF
jgi:hypothetical protein